MGFLVYVKKAVKVLAPCTALFLFCFSAFAEDQPKQLYEQKIKAGLVYNLLKYTVWPHDVLAKESGKFQICLYGDDPFDGYLAPLEGRTAQQIPIFITRITQIQQAQNCSVVVIHRSEESHLPELLQFLQNKNVLTISDIKEFAQRGGMVEMAREDDKISLYINKDAVTHAGLDIQGAMLKLAKIVPSKVGA